MPLIYDCQAKRDIAEQVFDIGKTLLMWLWLVRILSPSLLKIIIGGGSWRRKTGRDDGRGFGCAWWLDFWPGWRIKYQQIILLMWANHYHRNPTLPPVEISFSGRLNTFVGNLSLGQCLEITLSLFKWWNLMFSYWTLMFGMYLKPFWSI